MKNSQHLGFWFLLAILGFFATPLIRTGPSMEEFLTAEIRETRQAKGDQVGGLGVSFADGLFRQTPLAAIAASATTAQHGDDDR